MAPPSWAKSFVLGSGRRLQSKNAGDFFDDFFSDETETSKLMRGHMFYLLTIIFLVLFLHKLLYVFCKWKGVDVPPIFVAPGVEVQVFLAVFMVREGGHRASVKYLDQLSLSLKPCFFLLIFYLLDLYRV